MFYLKEANYAKKDYFAVDYIEQIRDPTVMNWIETMFR